MTSSTRRTVRNGSVELSVHESGNPDGPTVLLVHGWPDTHHLWNGVAEELGADFRVVSYDTRGQGESSDPGSVEAFALEELAADVLAVADAVSPERPVHLVGHDWGSVEGWEAVCEPGAEERFASFTSISGPNLDHLAHWLRQDVSPRKAVHLAAQAASSSYIWFFISPAAPWVFRRTMTRERWLQLLRRAEGRRIPDEGVAPTLVDDMVSGLRIYRANVRRRMREPRERRTAVPVLQLVPTKDVAVRSASYEATPQWVERVERREVPYGHWVAMSHPEVVAAEVARFVREVESSEPTR